ncbi:MAG: TatD family hydrolase, partial [Planctomycetia bacterium]
MPDAAAGELFDSHCHLDPMRFGAELPDVLARARAAGVSGMTVIGTRAADSEAAAELAAREAGIVAAAGIHPNDVAEAEPGEWERIVRLAESGLVGAIGETGLDWYRTTAPAELQREFFGRHLRLAQRLSLPVVIHTRESIRDVLDTLRAAAASGPLAAGLHASPGTAAEAAEASDRGCHHGVAGRVTFRSAAAL